MESEQKWWRLHREKRCSDFPSGANPDPVCANSIANTVYLILHALVGILCTCNAHDSTVHSPFFPLFPFFNLDLILGSLLQGYRHPLFAQCLHEAKEHQPIEHALQTEVDSFYNTLRNRFSKHALSEARHCIQPSLYTS